MFPGPLCVRHDLRDPSQHNARPLNPLSAVAWLVAVVLTVVAAAFCAGIGWVSWLMLSNAVNLFEGAGGWLWAYLIADAIVTSHLVVRLAPLSLASVRSATREYPDRISKLAVGLWTLYPHLYAVGLLALPSTILWPVFLSVFWRWQRRRLAAEAEAVAAADARQVEALRAAIRKG